MDELTQDDKEAVTFYLGYPSKILKDNSTHFNRIFNDRMTNLSEQAVKRTQELLGLIAKARENLDQTQVDAHVTRIDEISMDSGSAVGNIKRQYNRYLKELSILLDIPIRSKGGRVTL